jgi:peptide/nickel transport system ATP-binding protein
MVNDTPLLEIENLCISYFTRAGEIPAVVDFSLTLDAGESVGLVGESGCGKSTVAMAIMRYLGGNGRIVGGSIKFKGRDLATLDREALRRIRGAEIAMIYQEPMAALNPSLRIGYQLMEVPMTHQRMDRTEAWERCLALLRDVHLPDPQRVMTSYPHQLSGGQQQRVVIAMALLSDPALLLLDEPTTALDVTVEASIVRLIAELGERYGAAQLYISHNLGLIMTVCERVGIMYSGEVVEEGRVEAVFSGPLHPYTHGLIGCIPLPGADKHARPLMPIPGRLPLPHQRPQGCYFGPRCDHFKDGLCDAGAITMEPTAAADAGRRVRCSRWSEIRWERRAATGEAGAPIQAGEEILRVEAMQKVYEVRDRSLGALISGQGIRHVKANEALSFSARGGETVAIVGESGCGKSTFAKVLMGLETATDGQIHFDGSDIGTLPVQERTPDQLGALQMIFQNPSDTLNPSHTVGAQIERVIKKFGIEPDKSKRRERVLRLLDRVKLPRDFYSRRPRQLSGGQKQRIGIARAFAGRPALVVADEPVSALDVSVAAAVIELLMDIQREHRTTLLFISHDLSVVRYLADRVIVMYLGQIMEAGTTEEIFNPPYHPYTEALLSAAPIADPGVKKREIVLAGNLPSAMNPPVGCPFETRCPRKLGKICEAQRPPVQRQGADHRIACHIPLGELRVVEPVISLH